MTKSLAGEVKQAHTPGPLGFRKVSKAEALKFIPDDIELFRISTFAGGWHSLCYLEKDASLIASAPELLEACKEALVLVKHECEAHNAGDLERGDFSLLEQLEDVIKRAEGR